MSGFNKLRWEYLKELKEALDMGIPLESMDNTNLINMFKQQIDRYRAAKELCSTIERIKEGFEQDFKKFENELFWELLDKNAFGDHIL
ncbi:hypothetical protein [Bacillus sp. AFS088145]|uniref:hypothetical protein n=1 Tax=Bacillus sp. AFS088145 TaxID=2033514 RepID=UPI000BF816E6|nr:hypothetical protein [Bacillus sp. AFS088145]PFH91386.1 hypothetical protein COI44_01920 [Bacillus sp. AFS088145]